MKEIPAHQVIANSDTMEWRWVQVVVWNFSHEKDALLVAIGKWTMWWDADVRKEIIRIFDSVEEYEDHTWDFPEETVSAIRKKALRKLDARERKILWLTEDE